MLKREIKRVQKRLSPFLDPLAVVALIMVVVLPTLAVLNLSPLAKKSVNSNANVLGESDGNPIGVVLVGGIHDYITNESLEFPSEKSYTYTASISSHNQGQYSKPVFQIVNNNSSEKTLELLTTIEIPSQTQVSIVMNDKEYVLVSTKGEPYTVTIPLEEASENLAYLRIISQNSVLFSNRIELQITER